MTDSVKIGRYQVSRVGMGGCPLGGHGWGEVDDQQARAAVRAALDAGVTVFDTADCYGLGYSERLLAEELGARRNDVFLCTKFGVRWDDSNRTWKDSSAEYMKSALSASLERLRLDRIPLYYVHWLDGETPIEETAEALGEAREQGLIEHVGFSNVSASELERACAVTRVDAVQVRGSVLHRAPVQSVMDVANEHSVHVFTWGTLGEGMLTGKIGADTTFSDGDRRNRYPDFQGERRARGIAAGEAVVKYAKVEGKSPAQVALRWALDGLGGSVALFGAKRPSQAIDNAGALGWSLRDSTRVALNEVRPFDD